MLYLVAVFYIFLIFYGSIIMSKRSEIKPGFADIAYANRRRRINFLDKINELIDWEPIEKKLNRALKRQSVSVGAQPYPAIVMFKEALIKWLRERSAALRGARNLAYQLDMSRFLRSVRLALRLAHRFIQHFHNIMNNVSCHFCCRRAIRSGIIDVCFYGSKIFKYKKV